MPIHIRRGFSGTRSFNVSIFFYPANRYFLHYSCLIKLSISDIKVACAFSSVLGPPLHGELASTVELPLNFPALVEELHHLLLRLN